MANKWVYLFTEGNANMRELLGGKGANLAEMTGLGLPVPQGFTITTEACTQYYEDGREINASGLTVAFSGISAKVPFTVSSISLLYEITLPIGFSVSNIFRAKRSLR